MEQSAGQGTLSSDHLVAESAVAMRDGVPLATDVYLPSRSHARLGGRFPTVLVRLPYDKRGPIAFMPQVADYVAERGYAVVVQDVRGKCASGGVFDPFVQEVADGWDTLEWVSNQPWSDGRVGMLGDSYYGFTQWAAAASGHPALRCIVPRVTSTRLSQDWMYHDGVFCLGTMLDWAAQTWVGPALPTYDRDWSPRPLSGLIGTWLGAGADSSVLRAWRSAGPDSPWWLRRPLDQVHPTRLAIPALHIGGWWDVFRRGQLRDWATAAATSPAPQKLIMAATDHIGLEFVPGGKAAWNFVNDREKVEAFLPTYLTSALQFLDEHVRDHGSDRSAPVRFQLAGAGWRESATWPPQGVTETVLWLADGERSPVGPHGGALSPVPDSVPCSVTFRHDPADLVPTLDEDLWAPLSRLPDERLVEGRDDVLTFTGDPVDAPLDLVGPATAELEIAAPHSPAQVVVKLVDVYPDGYAQRVTEGIAQHRTREPHLVRVDLAATAYRLHPGHRLRLEVAASQFPRYLPVLGAGADPWEGTPGAPSDHRLHLGGTCRSRLRLTVAPSPLEA